MNKYDSLTPNVLQILRHKATERPFSGQYNTVLSEGTYLCRGCGLALFRAHSQFNSSCGWPSFDMNIANNVKRVPDKDQIRTEIICNRCDGHLGHVFEGEGFTRENTRHCVNSIAVEYVQDQNVTDSEEAIVCGGCFWGVEHCFSQIDGVLLAESGYIGGTANAPSYEKVCSGRSGYLEAVRVVYNPKVICYEDLLKIFFEIHDASQANGQGPDIGPQYLSAIFYFDEQQLKMAQTIIAELKEKGIVAQTQLYEMSVFWPAEDYHQQYYRKTGKTPYCHIRKKIF